MLRFRTVRITVTTTTNLWNQILLDPPQLGLFSAIFCHHSLFVKFMCEVAVLIVEQRTADTDTISLGLNQKDCHLKRKKKSKHLCNLCFQLRIPAAATSPGHTRKSEFLFLHLSQF